MTEIKRAPSVSGDVAEDWVAMGHGDVGIRCYGWRTNTGKRPALVWGHANGFSAGAYTPILNVLAEKLDVFAYDMRCHGGSEDPVSDPDGDYDAVMTTDCLALDFLAVVDSIRRDTFRQPLHFAGHSASCLAALRLAGAFGHAPFHTMTMFEPPMAPTPDHALHAAAGVLGEVLSRRATKRKRHLPDPARSLPAWQSATRLPAGAQICCKRLLKQRSVPMLILHNTTGWTLRCEPAAEAAVYRTTMDCSTFKALSACTRPILFVESDPTIQGVAPSWATRVQALSAAQAPKGSLARIDQTSHMMPFERPDAVLALITKSIAVL